MSHHIGWLKKQLTDYIDMRLYHLASILCVVLTILVAFSVDDSRMGIEPKYTVVLNESETGTEIVVTFESKTEGCFRIESGKVSIPVDGTTLIPYTCGLNEIHCQTDVDIADLRGVLIRFYPG